MTKELGYLVVAAGASVLAVAPLGLHDFPLDPRLVPWAAGFAVLWTGLRLGLFLRAWSGGACGGAHPAGPSTPPTCRSRA